MEGAEWIKTVILEAFRNAAPHLCEPSKIRELIEDIVRQATSMSGVISRLQEEVTKRNAATERTDLKIFLLFLEREFRKRET
ncbi:MAG: hypothetical protein QXW47_01280 [Candidatus Jordarchaeales archaeon]|nr:hypothetical protein [Candidatus Jordarchaeia archaeon]